jgi:isopropylmalate/homocitrate/citramalate synthase
MSLLYQNRAPKHLRLHDAEEPELYRELFPYSRISRMDFDNVFFMPRPAESMFITDTTFRDGQQARPPYTAQQIARIFDLLHKLGGKTGLIRSSEFFIYSKKDRKAVEACRARGYRFPRVTAWIRADKKDLKLARDMEFDEVGMLTSVSDYHIFLKLGKTRKQAVEGYLDLVTQALEWGIVPRCHFEDVTRADIYGFCLPFTQRLMELARSSAMPVKIRLCDTMGYGVPYAGAALPRSVQRIVHAFTDEGGVSGNWLEWHGHNDFHKVLVNGVTAWLHGCGGVNGTLLGFGERTGNSPIEGLVVEYISLTGRDSDADTTVITEIARFFESELDYRIPDNYPFVGREFNATSAGVHVDGLSKNEEIYNIFDTMRILGRPTPIIITDKSGRAGVAYWLNTFLELPPERQLSKKHPSVGAMYERIMQSYEDGRSTSYSNKELQALAQNFFPEYFESEFDHIRKLAGKLAAPLIAKLAESPDLRIVPPSADKCFADFVQKYPFIQYLYLTDTQGKLLHSIITDPTYRQKYEPQPLGYDFSEREWFKHPMRSGDLHISSVAQSRFTGQLYLTVSCAVTNAGDSILGVLGADIQLEAILKRAQALQAEIVPEEDGEAG